MDRLINDFSPGLFIMQAVILLLLIILMRKFAWKPILNALEVREEGIREALDKAENAQAEYEKLNKEKEELLAGAKADRDQIISEAQTTAKAMVEEAKDAAKVEAQAVADKARAAIEAEKKAAVAALKNEAALLSVQIAEQVLRKELSDKKAQEALIQDYIKEADLTA